MHPYDPNEQKHKFQELKADYDPHEDEDPFFGKITANLKRVFFFRRGFGLSGSGFVAVVLILMGVFGLIGWGELRDQNGRELVGAERFFDSTILLLLGVIIGSIVWYVRRKRRS